MCERCNIARTYVDLKKNSENANITIKKTDTTELPMMKIRELYDRHLEITMQKQKEAIWK